MYGNRGIFYFQHSLWNNVVTLKTENPRDLLAYRILLLNGLGIYTTWTTLASLINIAVALLYDGEVGEPAPSLIALSFLAILLALWVPLELIFWDNYFRYMMTPLFGKKLHTLNFLSIIITPFANLLFF